jgi:hypothetical protein
MRPSTPPRHPGERGHKVTHERHGVSDGSGISADSGDSGERGENDGIDGCESEALNVGTAAKSDMDLRNIVSW